MFIPLLKVDAAQRLVYGSFDETPDRAKEICDYATAKIAFQSWSEDMHKASGGKSFGNIRGQHNPKIAAGLLKAIEFDDEAKRIDFCAKIVDDNEWQKVEEGVYTGFSPGGSYAKRWADGSYHRYTPKVGELSIVDVPCNPAAGFMLIKADGSEEEVQFLIAKAYEPGNDATRDRAIALALEANPGASEAERNNLAFRKNFVGKARAELIAEAADAELEKLAKAAEPGPGPDEDDHSGEAAEENAIEKADRVGALEAALEKADKAAQAPAPAAEDNSEPESDLVKGIRELGDLAKIQPAIALIEAAADSQLLLRKGMYSVQRLASLIDCASDLQCSINWEESAEAGPGGEPGNLPKEAAAAVASLCTLLVHMVAEECQEIVDGYNASGLDIDFDPSGDPDVLELAAKICDLAKAENTVLEKAGRRNSAKDSETIQGIHDGACTLGADCGDASAEKVAELSGENERLAKSVDSAIPRIEALAATVESLKGDLAKSVEKIAALEAQPVLGKGAVFSRSKEEDSAGEAALEKGAPEPGSIEAISAMPPGRERSRALELAAQRRLNESR